MLLELRIKNFAIIDNLSISFGPGLNVFTGETGAGKSIIVDALSLVLGDRATNEVIRTNSDEAQVEALFDISGRKGVREVLRESGIDIAETLVIKRVIHREGRNKIYINGSLATLVTLFEVGSNLVDVCGQSEHQSLVRPEEHLEVVDSFGNLSPLRDEMSRAYRKYISLKKELDSLLKEGASIEARKDLLAFQFKEIADAGLAPDEEVTLTGLKERLKHAEKIRGAAEGAEKAIYSEQGSITERLSSLTRALKEVSSFDEKLAETVERLSNCLYELEDSSSFLRSYAEKTDCDPSRLEEVMERIDLIQKLKKKYGPTVGEILARKEAIERELSEVSGLEGRIKELESGLNEAKKEAEGISARLTELRGKISAELKKKIEGELSGLGMKGSLFEVLVETETENGGVRLAEKGSDRVSFYISTNPGEGVKPLSRVASGGELSRVMLAIKGVTVAHRVPTLIFDEIDAGVGGAMAHVVGLKLKKVSKAHQVLLVTHLPQIAAFADTHFAVKKEASGGRTISTVEEVAGEARVEQISRMLGGIKVTETTRKHAKELLDAARSSGGAA